MTVSILDLNGSNFIPVRDLGLTARLAAFLVPKVEWPSYEAYMNAEFGYQFGLENRLRELGLAVADEPEEMEV